MKHDERLVEAVARAICSERGATPDYDDGDGPIWTIFRDEALAALDAIAASGTHWVAPWDPGPVMWVSQEWIETYEEARDAYLAEQTAAQSGAQAEAGDEAR